MLPIANGDLHPGFLYFDKITVDCTQDLVTLAKAEDVWYYTPFAYPLPPPTHREILKKGQVCPYTFCCYINGWCFLDLQWTFYRALLPIYIKKDSGVFVTDLARADLLTDSCQVFVLQLYLCNDSVDG